MVLPKKFQEIVGKYQIASENQRKVWEFIRAAATWPPSPPESPDYSVEGTSWVKLHQLWKEMHNQDEDNSGRKNTVSAAFETPKPSTGKRRSDISVCPMALPTGHETYMLKEAREYYRSRDEMPAFVSQKQGGYTRSVVIPTDDAKVPDIPTRATVVKREWNSEFIYYTLDVNDKRLIVKSFPGGHPKGGVRYLFWRGPLIGFEKTAVAFSELQTDEASPGPNTNYSEIQGQEASSPTDLVKSLRGSRQARDPSTTTSLRDFDSNDQEVSEIETAKSRPSNPKSFPESSRPLQCSDITPSASHSSCPANFTNASHKASRTQTFTTVTSPLRHQSSPEMTGIPRPVKKVKTSHSSPTLDRVQDEAPQAPQQPHTVRESPTSTGPPAETFQAPGQPHTARQSPASTETPAETFQAPQQPHTMRESPAPTGQQAETSDAPEPSPIVRESPNSIGLQANAVPPNLTSVLTRDVATMTHETVTMPLAKYKQDNTKLRIWLNNGDRFTSVRFRSCPTTWAFFDRIADAVNISKNGIADVTVIFDWKEEVDNTRKMAMRAGDEDCIEDLIEEVDNASVWAPESGRCVVGVLVQTRGGVAAQPDVKR